MMRGTASVCILIPFPHGTYFPPTVFLQLAVLSRSVVSDSSRPHGL